MSVNTLKIYEILSSSLPEKQAKSVTKAIENALEEDWSSKKEVIATKADISKLELKIESIRSELIKWMFIFWISQLGILSGIIFAMLKLYFR
ncbi:MAG: hypothetical protein SCARUB_03598 [Candidatus Scalindua rubra]|uniref:DUF1640 domain-containing protein n=1 Tax=Candidatus Scalindua rubra TaxID=1872076 RepID=A0A1E3X6M5_9BACT|nr:MAG: hypothetical protein SCARUB_03598 [Candidatus Scalindua rubra]